MTHGSQKQALIPRRRFLSICAQASITGAAIMLPGSGALASQTVPLQHWTGILLGAEVHLSLGHSDPVGARAIIRRCVTEIQRLENIFTLYDSHSELSRLNRDGFLDTPSPELRDILHQARSFHTLTDGAFDVTVQPLWDLYKGRQALPPPDLLRETLERTGMNKLMLEGKSIRFDRTGMGITLNGIAQGYITDHITEYLKREGLQHVLVELGEKRAIGPHPDGQPWRLALPDHDNKAVVALNGKALATSTAQNPDTGDPHIYSAQTGTNQAKHKAISVVAERATEADALSTAFLMMKWDDIQSLKKSRSDIHTVYRC